MSVLCASERNLLERTTIRARDLAEEAADKALQVLAVRENQPRAVMSPADRRLRVQLRAVSRRLGGYEALKQTCAYEHWHRMLFARFLAENGFLIHPGYQVPVTLEECAELAREEGEPDRWVLAARFAARMLPGIFPQDDPLLEVRLASEDRVRLEGLLESIPPEVFTSDDGLGWTYQFWQSKRKSEVQASGVAVQGADVAAVTQLFTEHYMVQFLLQNSLGAWWISLHPDSPLRKEWEYYRPEVKHDFSAWPKTATEVRMIDPCCGSGHFLLEAFNMLSQMRHEEGESPADAVGGVLRDNVFGLELDARCVQIAAFALALAAWRAGFPLDKALPVPNIACCGLPLGASQDEWRALANGDADLANALSELHTLFANAEELGSLIEPSQANLGGLLEVDRQVLLERLERALGRERNIADPVSQAFGEFARGTLRAFNMLRGRYHLVATNPPFLARGKQSGFLKNYCSTRFRDARKDLATCFLERCRTFTQAGGSYALVNPQNWLFLRTYGALRARLLHEQSWLTVARLGAHAFETIGGEIVQVVLIAFRNSPPPLGSQFLGLDAAGPRKSDEKAQVLSTGGARLVSQSAQCKDPDAVITLEGFPCTSTLGHYAVVRGGITTGDSARFRRCFWEVSPIPPEYVLQQSTVHTTVPYGGREFLLLWEDGQGELAKRGGGGGATIAGREAWGKEGIAVSYMSGLRVTLYTGELFENVICVIVPRNPGTLAAIWAFCRTEHFAESVRKVNQKLSVDVRYFEKVPFEHGYWQAKAEEAGPLPEPHSEDPTQWLFKGDVKGSEAPLQVAVARLLGYRWPEQPEEDEIMRFTDPDGIVCLPPVGGEHSAADRLRALLAAAYGAEWSAAMEATLLAEVGYGGGDLEVWLRDGFFSQHARLFHNRPFIWHIWDGRKDGFSALVNYHGLDRAKLEKLIYTYLGAWITRQKDDIAAGRPGTEVRLAAAQDLVRRLELILVGDDPYDIYVRWKPVEKQAIGWDPDLNDGVRLNIRPFVMANVLRSKVTVNWNKDRGRDPDGSERINDRHFSLDDKRKAREAAK